MGGLLAALAATRALTVLASAGMPRADQIRMDAPVLLFALGVDPTTALRGV